MADEQSFDGNNHSLEIRGKNRNILATGRTVRFSPRVVLPRPFAILQEPLQEDPPRVIERPSTSDARVADFVDHHLMANCGITIAPDFEMYRDDRISQALERAGVTNWELAKYNEIFNYQMMVLLCNMRFPDFTMNSPMAKEYLAGSGTFSTEVRRIYMVLLLQQTKKFGLGELFNERSPEEILELGDREIRLFELGGQQGEAMRMFVDLLRKVSFADRITADIVDLVLEPRIDRNIAGCPLEYNPYLRFIQDDAARLDIVDAILRQNQGVPLGPYDYCLEYETLSNTFDRIRVMEKIWDRLKVGGIFILGGWSVNSPFNWPYLEPDDRQKDALFSLGYRLRRNPGIMGYSDDDWRAVHSAIRTISEYPPEARPQTLLEFAKARGIPTDVYYEGDAIDLELDRIFPFRTDHPLNRRQKRWPMVLKLTKDRTANPFTNSTVVGLEANYYHGGEVPLLGLRRMIS